jgi:hypothetical protein
MRQGKEKKDNPSVFFLFSNSRRQASVEKMFQKISSQCWGNVGGMEGTSLTILL